MFTKNYNYLNTGNCWGVALNQCIGKAVAANGTLVANMDGNSDAKPTIGTNGIETAMTTIASEFKTSSSTSANGTNGVVFGTGNNAPTTDDYTLSGDFISGLSSSNVTYTTERNYDVDTGERSYTVAYTIINTTGADITIGEVGLAGTASRKYTSNSWYYYISVLYERTALETPITIPAGGIGRITYTISGNMYFIT